MEFSKSSNSKDISISSEILFRTKYGIVNIIDPESIKRFQIKAGISPVNGRMNSITKSTIIQNLLNPEDKEGILLDKAHSERVRRASGTSTQEARDLVGQVIKESEFFRF